MRVLVYGAGVLGSLYGAKLRAAGHAVTILARGHRFQFICENGIVLMDGYGEHRTEHEIPVVDRLDPNDPYDLILVFLRKHQIASILAELAASSAPDILFMGNNVRGPDDFVDALGSERVLMGFPGAGGIIEDEVVKYIDSDEGRDATWGVTIGELDGGFTPRLERIRSLFKKASIPVELSHNIYAWVLTHAAIVLPIAHALYLVEGGTLELADRPDVLRLLIFAIREGLSVQETLGIPVIPRSVRMYKWVPSWVTSTVMRARFSTRMAEIGIEGHALAAQDEMAALAAEYAELMRRAGIQTPALRTLYNTQDEE